VSEAGRPMEHDRYNPLKIWRSLDPGRKLRAATVFWKSPAVKPPEIEVAAALLAQALHFRPQSIRTAPLAKRAAYLANFAAMPDHLAANLLYAYHLGNQVPLMSRFLDVAGIAHEEGRIQGETKPPEKAKLEEAADALFRDFDARDVTIYLETLVSQDEETWGGLREILTVRETR
jgi:hypothetical protein